MKLSPASTTLLASLDAFSGSKLTRRDDLGVLIELALSRSRTATLEELSFFAKFISKAYGIMRRIGKDGEGFDPVAKEFEASLERARTLATELLTAAPADTRRRFEETYLALNPNSFQNLLDLFYDLSWYKNWLIDNPLKQR